MWPKLVDTFAIRQIGEFYSATEATSGMLNYSTDAKSGMGACGRVGPILSAVFKSRIVEFDVSTEMPVRDSGGRCVPVDAGQVGELIVFVDPRIPLKRYDGISLRETM